MRKTCCISCIATLLSLSNFCSRAQSILPPELPWHGKSEALVAQPGNPWITPAERENFRLTPDYATTMRWCRKLAAASPLLHVVTIGRSVEGRAIVMVVASAEKNTSAEALRKSGKLLLLAQAGIHAGEIDGKDAGMMLLRDIAFGGKQSLLEKVNFLFIPILNVDGHERASSYNRPNQRGPENMGWRTNAQNLNLNRDYAKLDTREVRSVIGVINTYKPDLYMDIHVTDGADYQYDITYGGLGKQGYSPHIRDWLENTMKLYTDKSLQSYGHIPGPLLNAVNNRDFTEGNIDLFGGPRFSDSYGDARHLPAVLVENHSLKPYKQRVLGTYVLLEATLKIMAVKGQSLRTATREDQVMKNDSVPMAWKVPQMKGAVSIDIKGNEKNDQAIRPDSMQFLAMASILRHSGITNNDYVEWLGKKDTMMVADFKSTQPNHFISRPKGYWVPSFCEDIIARLKLQGVTMTMIHTPRAVPVEMYRVTDYAFGDENHQLQPFEGHMQVTANTSTEMHNQVFPAGSVYVPADQPLGDLAMLLLEPASADSYFSWGFFMPIFQRTEYIEDYVMEPTAKKMLAESPDLKKEFEERKTADSSFRKDPNAILSWFYSKTKYYDNRYLLYPVGKFYH